MLEHLNRNKFLRAKIRMQNVLKRQIPLQNFTEERCIAVKFWERVSIIFCCVSTFKNFRNFYTRMKRKFYCNIYIQNTIFNM